MFTSKDLSKGDYIVTQNGGPYEIIASRGTIVTYNLPDYKGTGMTLIEYVDEVIKKENIKKPKKKK